MAQVKIIRPGYFKWIGTDKFKAVCNVTLVMSGNLKLLVDAGGVGEAEEIRKSLGTEGILPEEIDILILTHHHSDHAGGMDFFKNAVILDWAVKWRGGEYEIWRDLNLKISEDVEFVKTPGHTPECASLLVETEQGIVAIVGDLWQSGADEHLLLIYNKEKLEESREFIKSKADFIIPGHDKMFRSGRQ